MGQAKEDRNQLGADIVSSMSHNGEFPVKDMYLLADIMMRYFESEGYKEMWEEEFDYKWLPTEGYWQKHLKDVRDTLRRSNHFLEFVRENGSFKGAWRFVKKREFEELMDRERKEIQKRGETYNERVKAGRERWKLTKTPEIGMELLLPFDEVV
jgi:hypothetical protein